MATRADDRVVVLRRSFGTVIAVLLVLLLALGVVAFFVFGGEVHGDLSEGRIDLEAPWGDDAPDVDVDPGRAPDVDVDSN